MGSCVNCGQPGETRMQEMWAVNGYVDLCRQCFSIYQDAVAEDGLKKRPAVPCQRCHALAGYNHECEACTP